jgi:hypothetical protein
MVRVFGSSIEATLSLKLARKRGKRTHNQHGDHQNIELIDDGHDAACSVIISLSMASPRLEAALKTHPVVRSGVRLLGRRQMQTCMLRRC